MTVAARRGKTAGVPFRQTREPKPIASLLDLGVDMAAILVAERVKSIGQHRSCCAYVFVRDGLVYVVSEESSMAHQWAVKHAAEWVGCYGGMIDVARMVEELSEMLPIR